MAHRVWYNGRCRSCTSAVYDPGAGHGHRNVDAELVSKMASLLGYREDAEALASLAETIRQAFCREFVNLETGAISDESDRKFLDVATSCQAILVTGNHKHFPEAEFIMTAKTFLGRLGNR